jgi:hypothetical protein
MENILQALILITIVSLAAAFGFAVAFIRERQRFQALKLYAHYEGVKLFMDIANRWGELYSLRNEIMALSIDANELRKEYGSDYVRFLNSDEWKKMRELCHFFEVVGLCVHERQLNPEMLFVIITVDDKDHLLSKRLIPVIEYLREIYRPDLYMFYDKFLLPLYNKNRSRKSGFAGKTPKRIP